MKNYNGWAYAYDAENRLTSVSGNGHSATLTYDAVGRCVKRVIDGVTTILTYDQWTPVAEWDGNGNIMAANVFGLGDDEILYRGTTSAQLLYKSDPMGNVKFVLDISSNGIEKYTYDGFGQPTITDANGNTLAASTYGNRFMFSGREYFSELGLYDMRNRVYDPVMGRFYQTDPIGFDGDPLNLYRFCGNNPLLGGDPMGLQEGDGGGLTIGGDWGSFDFGGPSDENSSGGESNWLEGYLSAGLSLSGTWDFYSARNEAMLDSIFGTGSSTNITYWESAGVSLLSLFVPSSTVSLASITSTGGHQSGVAQGTFTINFIQKFSSGTNVDITYRCPTCKNIRLIQYIRGYLPRDMGGYNDWFVPDKALYQTSRPSAGIVTAVDQAGAWADRPSGDSAIPTREKWFQRSHPSGKKWRRWQFARITAKTWCWALGFGDRPSPGNCLMEVGFAITAVHGKRICLLVQVSSESI
jgi:RHS repeat-associated protein